jgi:hypothetical protein
LDFPWSTSGYCVDALLEEFVAVTGHYVTRQWKEFDPHVEPLEVIDQEGGLTDVKVHQLVKSLDGDVLSDSEVWHVYTIANGLIERMDLKESETSSYPTPSTAFSRH